MLERSDRTAPGRALQSRDRRRGPGLPPGSSFVVGGSMEVTLGENDRLENVLKKFRRQITKAGLFQDMKRNRFYESPGAQRRRKDKGAQQRKLQSLSRRPERYIASVRVSRMAGHCGRSTL